MGTYALYIVRPAFQALVIARDAAQQALHIIDREPIIPLNVSRIKQHELKGEVKFDHVTFKALKDFNFKFEEGKTTAILGPSGSGKSTITQLI